MLGYSTGDITLSHVALAGFIGYLGYSYYINFYYPRHVGPLKSIPGPSNEFWQSIRFMYYRLSGKPREVYKELHAQYGPICHSGIFYCFYIIIILEFFHRNECYFYQ
jgi:hypothetical protein